ncbi:hypothetical protein [Streptomyces sp. NPDC058317]|uniref:hypothetical protein n=1 Tax=Streptomyces sp. NPDC058317 TaxID=3346443 RepID=UPI0036ECA9A7
MRKVALRPYALLPRQYDHEKVLATTVDAWGRALWLICPDAEVRTSRYGWTSPVPRTSSYDAVLVISRGSAVRERPLHGITLQVVRLDALPHGRVVLHGYGATADQNTQIHGADGRQRHGFDMGIAVEYLMADRRHHLWSAYFDEGVYVDPISAAGLVRWDSGGNHEWGYRPPAGVPTAPPSSGTHSPSGGVVISTCTAHREGSGT